MRITKIKLTNFGPHKSWELSTTKDKPIVEIIGLNGSGKSHILHALKYAFTGTLDYAAESYVTAGEKKSEVLVEFEKEGIKGTICRTFGPTMSAKRSFTWGDDAPITVASAVDKKLEEVLGADKQTILNAVFISQGEIAGLLADTAAQRIGIFSKLLNLHFIDKRIRNVDGWIDNLKKQVKDLRPAQDQITSTRLSIKEKLANEQNALNQLEQSVGSEETIKQQLALFEDYDKQLQLAQRAELELYSVQQDLAKTAENKEDTETWEDYLDRMRDLKQVQEKIVEKTTEDIASLKNNKQVIESVKRFLKDQDTYFETVNKIKAYKEEFKNKSPIDVQTSHEDALTYIKLKSELKALKLNLTELEAQIPELRSQEAECLSIIEKKSKEVEELEAKIEFARNVRANLQNYLEAKIKLKNKLNKETVICPSCGLSLIAGQEITDTAIKEQENQIAFFTSQISMHQASLKSARDASNQTRVAWEKIKYQISKSTDNILSIKDTIEITEDKLEVILKSFMLEENINFYANIDENKIKDYQYVTNFAATNLKDLSYPGALPAGFVGDYVMDGERYIIAESELDAQSITNNLQIQYNRYENLSQYISHITTQIISVEHLLKDVAKAQTHKAQCEKALSTHPLKQSLSDISQRILSNNKGNTAIDVRDELENIKNQYIQLKTLIGSYLDSLKSLDEQEAELKRLENENLKTYEAITELEKIKGLITPKTGITKDYLNYLFNIVTTYVSNYLSEMDSNFVIDIEDREEYEDLSFKFRRLDGESDAWLPMNKLSGGQKIKLSIAFLLSIQKIICPELCFLVLDEPSTHLDTPSIIALKNLLRSMNETMMQGDGQIWIVDHSVELKDDPAWDFNPEN